MIRSNDSEVSIYPTMQCGDKVVDIADKDPIWQGISVPATMVEG